MIRCLDNAAARGAVGRMFLLASCLSIGACKPAAPPDAMKRQQEALESAKAVDDVIQKQADDQRRRIEDASR